MRMRLVSKLAAVYLVGTSSVLSQIVTDGSLGTATALSGPAFQIPSTLGRTVGNNLFHSFQTINLSAGQSATFTGPNNIANVLSRVTGGSASTIDGVLRCNIPNANFYLINPSGVIFGPNAEVDVGGSFAVTTADYMRLADGGRFDGRTAANDVLTVAPPSAFGFLDPQIGNQVAGIEFRSAWVAVQSGRDLSVVAGEIIVDRDSPDPSWASRLAAPGGTVQMAAVNSAGEAPIGGLDISSFSTLGDIRFSGESVVTASSSGGGGSFKIRGQDFTIDGASSLGSSCRNSGVGGISEIELRGTLQISEEASISYQTSGGAQGGSLTIGADRILADRSYINMDSQDSSRGANLNILAREIEFSHDAYPGYGIVSSQPWDSSTGGDVSVAATIARLNSASISTTAFDSATAGAIRLCIGESLSITDSSISAGTRNYSAAAGGLIAVEAAGADVSLTRSDIKSSTGFASSGSAGDILVWADTLSVLEGSWIYSDTYGSGHSGNISITTDVLNLRTSGNSDYTSSILSRTIGDTGNAGTISVGTRVLDMVGGDIAASSNGGGNAGNILIRASEGISLDDYSWIHSWAARASWGTDPGSAGSITINAPTVALKNGSQIDVHVKSGSALSAGGHISISAEKSLTLESGGTISSDDNFLASVAASTESGANIFIEAGTVAISGDSSWIQATTSGSRNGGAIDLTTDNLLVSNGGTIAALTAEASTGNGGSIALEVGGLGLKNDGLVTAQSAGTGDAGSITVNSTGRIDLDSSEITVKSTSGNAGTITLNAPDDILLLNSRVSATAYLNGGNIAIDPKIFGLRNSTLNADATTGNGGHINVVADFVYSLGLPWNAAVTAISENFAAQQGTISIRSGIDFSSSLIGLPDGVVSEANQVKEGCARKNPRANSFIVRGTGGLPPAPDSRCPN